MSTSLKSSALPKFTSSAPWYDVPQKDVVTVEHPCIVQDVDKAVQMLGGELALRNLVHSSPGGKPIGLKFHPEDAFSQPIYSINRPTDNLLLKITVPKRTGRKRKRGSDEPFAESDESRLQESEEPQKREAGKSEWERTVKKDARYLLRSLQDNKETYHVEPIARIHTSHIFRTMPDFVYRNSNSTFLQEMRQKILPFQYSKLSEFQLDLESHGLDNTEVIPPPVLSTVAYPVNYVYRQNPAIKAYLDPATGSRKLYNTQAPNKVFTQQCQWNTPASDIPGAVSPDAPPSETEGHNFHGLVTILRTIFARRPIWTRRGLANQLPPNAPLFLAKYAVAYVAYAMRSGPWRDTYIRLGVDPRSDRSYRKYQTLMLQLVSSKKSKVANQPYEGNELRYWRTDPARNSHIFTGKGSVPYDGKSWQLCDLEDPILKKLVDIPDLHLRSECEQRYFGWYQNGTWCKLKVILKTKVDLLLHRIDPIHSGGYYAGEDIDNPDFDLKFERFLALPESYNIAASSTVPSCSASYFPPPPSSSAAAGEHSNTPNERTPWQAAGPEGDPLLGFLPRNASKMELEWASQYRALCRAPQGQLPPSGRLSRSKQAVRKSFVGDRSGAGGNEGMGGQNQLGPQLAGEGSGDASSDGDHLAPNDTGEVLEQQPSPPPPSSSLSSPPLQDDVELEDSIDGVGQSMDHILVPDNGDNNLDDEYDEDINEEGTDESAVDMR